MGFASGAVGRWTRSFVALSLVGFVLLATLGVTDAGRQTYAFVGLFGFLLPMVFGMAYVLLPPYVGRIFGHPWAAGLHFATAAAGSVGILAWAVLKTPYWTARIGSYLWTAGVVVFLTGLAVTLVPAIVEDPDRVLRRGDRPQRTTRLATAVIPVALGYLLAGHLVLATAGPTSIRLLLALPSITHFVATGFGALLVFALGIRLLVGFFHVDPPRPLTWSVLLPAATAPVLLAMAPLGSDWFLLGGVLESVAMLAYLALVATVAWRAERRRVGLTGILLGALAGVGAVTISLLAVTGVTAASTLDLHAVVVLQGFFGLTIVGYAFLFFPVTSGQYVGANRRGAQTVIALLALGLPVHVAGRLTATEEIAITGASIAILGALGYAYVLGRRLLRDATS